MAEDWSHWPAMTRQPLAPYWSAWSHCIGGQADAANKRITDALGTQDAKQDPVGEGDGDSEPAA